MGSTARAEKSPGTRMSERGRDFTGLAGVLAYHFKRKSRAFPRSCPSRGL